jgi:hypothetical protein
MKATPHAAVMAIINWEKRLDRDPRSNTRRYWNNTASFIKVYESGYVALPT